MSMSRSFFSTLIIYSLLLLPLSSSAKEIRRSYFNKEHQKTKIAFNGLVFPPYYSEPDEHISSIVFSYGTNKEECTFKRVSNDGKITISVPKFIEQPGVEMFLTIYHTAGDSFMFPVAYLPSQLHTLIVGNNTPWDAELNDLHTPENNADSLNVLINKTKTIRRYATGIRRVLKGSSPVDGKKANVENILKNLEEIAQSTSDGDGFNDCIIIFFSGHGKIDNECFEYEALNGTIAIQDILIPIQKMLDARAEVTLIVDACFSGGITASLSSLNLKHGKLKCALSSQMDEKSFESNTAYNSLFTHSILSSLRSNNYTIPVFDQLKERDYIQHPLVFDALLYSKSQEYNSINLYTKPGSFGAQIKQPSVLWPSVNPFNFSANYNLKTTTLHIVELTSFTTSMVGISLWAFNNKSAIANKDQQFLDTSAARQAHNTGVTMTLISVPFFLASTLWRSRLVYRHLKSQNQNMKESPQSGLDIMPYSNSYSSGMSLVYRF